MRHIPRGMHHKHAPYHKLHKHLRGKSKKDTRTIDFLAFWVGIIQPLATIPQIILVYSLGTSIGISLLMWFAYNIASVIVLIYGLRHRLKPIWIPQILWLMVQTPMMLAPMLLPA